jgi:hypothetical protein
MKKLFAIAMSAVMGLSVASAQTIPLFEHFGTGVYRVDKANQAPPNIDATAFVNYGTFVITNVIDFELYPTYTYFELPYEPGNMVNFTNRNRMSSLFGFRFNNATDTGRRRMGTFVNDNGATIDAVGGVQGENAPTLTEGFFTNILFLANTYLDVNASNIINRGVIRADNSGLVRLVGNKVDLTRGAVLVRPSQNIYDDYMSGLCYFGGTKSWFATNYWPDIGISDYYWDLYGYESNPGFQPASVFFPYFGGYASFAMQHWVEGLQPPYFIERLSWGIAEPISFVYTNDVDGGGTNIIIQAVFVTNTDTNVFINAAFGPSSSITNPWTSPVIEFSALQPDPVTGGFLTNRLYLMDYLLGETNNALQYNVNSGNVPTFCPGNYVVSRTAPCEYLIGYSPNTFAEADLFSSILYYNPVVTNLQTAYAFRMTNVATLVPANVSITNSGSRIEINADELKMDRTRIASEGFVSIKTRHLSSSTNAILAVEYLDLNLGSTNNDLTLNNLIPDSVTRFAGNVRAFSSSWTNYMDTYTTNITTDPDTGEDVEEIVTNLVTLSFHALIVDGRISTKYPVNILNLRTTSTNTTVRDLCSVAESLRVDAEALTIGTDGSITIRNPIGNWTTTNFPNLKYLTNLGSIVVTNVASLGADAMTPYSTLVNRGSIMAVSERISSAYFENSGTISSVQVSQGPNGSSTNFGPISIRADNAKLDTGTIDCGLDLRIDAGDLKMRNQTVDVRGMLTMGVTNTLSDNGAGSGNMIQVGNGFHLNRRAAGGDLLGTTLRTAVPAFSYIPHTWSAEDRGVSKAGFVNNTAIGRLIIDGSMDAAVAFDSLEPGSALYVDYLELRGTALTVEQTLIVGSNLTIYFADSNLAADQLDGKLNGRLRWVSEFAGPNSSVEVVAGGRTVKMNRALRNSPAFDSDGDGVANAFDSDPLTPRSGVVLQNITFTNQPPLKSVLAWDAAPVSITQLEASSTLPTASWSVIYKFTNDTLNPVPVKFVDPAAVSGARYYRLRYNQ